jgi:capsular polysaccharide transport system permease protein
MSEVKVITAQAPTEPASGGALTTVRESAVAVRKDHAAPGRRTGRGLLRRLAAWAPFMLVVGAPLGAAVAYFGFIAADRYVAEAQFVVRSADKTVASGLGALLQTTGLDSGRDDAFLVQNFLTSRDALREIEDNLGYSEIMGRAENDPLAAWPNWIDEKNFEGLYDFYQRRVQVVRDMTTGVSMLTVEAFRPEDARQIASALMEAGEGFINRMNERAQTDTVRFANREVALAEERLAESQRRFETFRRENGLIDPVADSEMRLELIGRLSGDIAGMEAEARRLRRDAPNSPQIPAIEARIDSLQSQLKEERGKLVGGDDALAEVYGSFESLTLEREFAQEALLAARAGLEQARAEALRKQRYLEVVVSPMAPDDAREPRRAMMILTVATSSLLVYAVIWLLYVNAREHRG